MMKFHDESRLRGIAKETRKLRTSTAVGASLVRAWNYATSPSVCHSDREHARCSKLAKAIDKRMRRLGIRFRELEDGERFQNG
jgi:hypothetical protein